MKARLLIAALITITCTILTARAQQAHIISINPAGPITWTSNIPGHAYTVRISTNPAGTWTNIASNIRPNTPSWTTNIGPTTNALRLISIVDNGRTANSNTPSNIGSLSGDTGMDQYPTFGLGDAFFQFTITEDNTSTHALSLEITLTSPAGCDYDLYLYHLNTPVASSTQPGTTQDYIYYNWPDTFGESDTRTFKLEIRRFSGTAFGNWSLLITGNPPT